MNEPLFIPASFFILRSPISPANDFQSHWLSPHWIDDVINDFHSHHCFREAIFVTSPSLYHAVKNNRVKASEKVARSLLFYAARMAKRATPFGLFSFTATGHWSDETTIEFKLSDLRKRTRLDMEWVWALIKKHYGEDLQNSDLTVCVNSLLQLNGDRINLDYLRYGEINELKNEVVSIRASKLSISILMGAKIPITIQALTEAVVKQDPNLDEKKVRTVILELFEKQFLLPAFLPSLLNLKLDDLPFQCVKKILEEAAAYDKFPIGQGEHALLQLQERMKNIVEVSSYLQTDLAYKDSPFSLSHLVFEEASRSVEFIWRLSAKLTHKNAISAYHNLFLERYGTHRTVPLLELLNEVQGIGPLANNPLIDYKEKESPFELAWDKWIHQRIQECLHKKEEEIVLHSDLLDHLLKVIDEPSVDYHEAMPSFDLFCKIIAQSQQEIDNGNFDLLFSSFAPEGGSSIGRFLDILGETTVDELRSFLENEEGTEPNASFVELSYWPKQARLANVAIQPCLRKYVLDTEEKEEKKEALTLGDVYVGATSTQLYFTDKNGESEIITRVGNLLNPERGPEPLRFLRAINSEKYKSFASPFSRKNLEMFIYIPRIRYNKTILSPARWSLDGSNFVGKSEEQIIKGFKKWAEDWNLPQFPLFIQGDNQLSINRDHPAFQKKIFNYLKNGERVEFTEDLSSQWVKGENGNHTSEIVIPFVKNKTHINKKTPVIPKPFYPTSFEKRWRLPGSEWIYYKFYLGKGGLEKFLIEHLFKFFKTLNVSWFFVRYRDPAHHLRLRILINKDLSLSDLLSNLEKALNFWMEAGLIKNIVLTSYEKEIERYGGEHLIESVENLFCTDSLSTIHLIQSYDENKFSFPSFITNSLSVIYFLKGFHFSNKQIMALLGNRIEDKTGLKGYREHKSLMNSLISDLDKPSPLAKEHFYLREAHAISQKSKEEFLKKANAISEKRLFEIVDSLLHMHCNRLTEDTLDEQKARHFAFRALFEAENRKVVLCKN